MSKYKVHEDTEGWRTFEVEADSPEEAREKVKNPSESWDSIEKTQDKTGYATVNVIVAEEIE